MSKYHDDNSQASDPGGVHLSLPHFFRLEPEAQGVRGWFWRQLGGGVQFADMLDEHLNLGDSRAACVVTIEPLLVAAYTDELDCVAMLAFPAWLVSEHALQPGTRLLTVNTYSHGTDIAPDLQPGPNSLKRFANFYPVIAEFLSRDTERISARKAAISAAKWQRCEKMGQHYQQRRPGVCRDGAPTRSATPARG